MKGRREEIWETRSKPGLAADQENRASHLTGRGTPINQQRIMKEGAGHPRASLLPQHLAREPLLQSDPPRTFRKGQEVCFSWGKLPPAVTMSLGAQGDCHSLGQQPRPRSCIKFKEDRCSTLLLPTFQSCVLDKVTNLSPLWKEILPPPHAITSRL